MRKEGDRLILEPARPVSLLKILRNLEPIEDEFPQLDDQPPGETSAPG